MAGADSTRLAELEQRIGYSFKNRALLDEALTHASVLETSSKARKKTYERLEFLGDRVLGLIMAEKLHADYPDQGESGLATRFNSLVNRAACARAARRAGLGPALVLATSEESQGGRDKEQILGDACESVIAALYLDGGFDTARCFVMRMWEGEFDAVKVARRDPKTVLQEWAAARKKPLTYALIERSGPEHAPKFIVEARVDGLKPARGEGGAKREAERAAAAAFLTQASIHD